MKVLIFFFLINIITPLTTKLNITIKENNNIIMTPIP